MVSQQSKQVIGIRLSKQTAVAFKKEAAGRNVRLNELFEEMWDLYWQVNREDQAQNNR